MFTSSFYFGVVVLISFREHFNGDQTWKIAYRPRTTLPYIHNIFAKKYWYYCLIETVILFIYT
jgi:hypothetical protein